MTCAEALAQIKKGLFRPVYLIYGEEGYLADKVERALIEALTSPEDREMSLQRRGGDVTASQLCGLVETAPFFGGKNVVCIRGGRLFKSRAADEGREDEKLLRLLENIPPYSHLIFRTAEKVDKRRKLFKTVEKYGAAIEAAPLKLRDMRGWLRTRLDELDKKPTADALEYLLGALSVMPVIPLGFLDQELEKLALYQPGKTVDKNDLLAVFSGIPEVSIFALLEAVSEKDVEKSLAILDGQVAAGEHPLKITALLARQVRLLWRAKALAAAGGANGELAAKLGVPSFVAEKLSRQSRGFAAAALRRALLDLAAADLRLKSGGADAAELEKILIALCA